jgi:hypothetical protein
LDGRNEAARKAIARSDQDRAAFIRDISGLDWPNSRNFHLVLDMSRCGLEVGVDRIVALLPIAGDLINSPQTNATGQI